MRKFLKYNVLISVTLSVPAFAQETEREESDVPPIIMGHEIRDSYINVVAHGGRSRIDETGQPLSIVTAAEIEQIQGADIIRVLERFPGVTMSRNGGEGGFSAMRVRGAEGEQLLVLIDGVRVEDKAAPGAGFDFGTLLPAGIGKIELLRSSNSTIWGSQAMGGVLAVSSGRSSGHRLAVEYGGADTVYATANTAFGDGPAHVSLDAAFRDGEGISAADGGTEADGFRQWQLGAAADVAFGQGFAFFARLAHVDARIELDGFPAPDFQFADTEEYQDTRRTFGHAGLSYAGGGLELRGVFSLSDTSRDSFDPAQGATPTYTTQGRSERAELRGAWAASNVLTVHFGAEREWSRFSTLFDAEQSVASNGAYAQIGYGAGAVTVNAGLRLDDHETFGSEWSLGADGAVRLGDGWRVRASYGEGFRAPSLFQLLSDFGNAALLPERSRSYDIAIERGDRNLGSFLALSAFRRDSEDLIGFTSCFGVNDGICAGRPFGTYDNIAAARAQGVEAEAAFDASDSLTLRGVYSYVEAVNRTQGNASSGMDLARRPRHALTLSADWSVPGTGFELGADLRVVSESFDDAANLVRLNGYAIGTIRANFPLTEKVSLFGRVENLWNEQYQTAAGYGTPGRSAFIGARARW